MENEVDVFHEREFRRLGMSEAYNDEAKKEMSLGAAEIVRRLHKEFDGDKVQADIHLVKHPVLNTYEIKMFELQLQKAGQENTLSQTFFVGKKRKVYDDDGTFSFKQNKYTLKEGYSLLSDRPVHKHFVSGDGEPYQKWVKMDLENKLPSGNYPINFDQNNFNLEKTLMQYAIPERYKASLIESLHRGNLQSTTFTPPDGAKEKLFVSPNLETGSLNVYGMDKKPIPTQQLLERNLVSKEFGEKLLQSEKLTQAQKLEEKQDIKKDKKQRPKM